MQKKESDVLGEQPFVMDVKVAALDSKPLVSADELRMLLAPSAEVDKAQALGRGFKYRNIFLLLCTLWFLVQLLFFPETIYQVFSLPLSTETSLPHLQIRSWLYLLWLLLYSWSYAKEWYFERVALVCFVSEATIFAMGYLIVFTHITVPMSPLLTFFVLLRLAFITCLLMNAVYAHQAPSASRSL